MTVPGGSYPDGTFDDDLTGLGGLDEATWKQSKFDAAVGPYNVAQGNFKGEFVSAVLVNGEIVRLDNRIDALEIGTERAYRYTYSESDVWTKHPAAYKVVVDVLSGGDVRYAAEQHGRARRMVRRMGTDRVHRRRSRGTPVIRCDHDRGKAPRAVRPRRPAHRRSVRS